VHGAEGNVLLYRELAEYLGKEQPVYGLQAQGLDGKSRLLSRIEDMAAEYIKEIRQFQPSGPYYLGGYCMGGGVALEISQQLRAQGEKVGFVILLETYNVSRVLKKLTMFDRFIHRIQRLQFQLDNLLLAGFREGFKFFVKKARVEQARYSLLLRGYWAKFSSGFSNNGKQLYPHLNVAKINDEAFDRYNPLAYEGDVVLFRPNKFFSRLKDPCFEWRRIVGEKLCVEVLPVSPRGMLVEPFVRLLAEKLRKHLDCAQCKQSDL